MSKNLIFSYLTSNENLCTSANQEKHCTVPPTLIKNNPGIKRLIKELHQGGSEKVESIVIINL